METNKLNELRIKEYKKEIELIKNFKSNSYKRRVKQLKLMIKRLNKNKWELF